MNDIYFQKCGEILYNAKCYRATMRCNFCHQLFKKFEAFLRHLRMEHVDVTKYGELTEKVNVYDFEDLVYQTSNSDVLESDEEDGYWLYSADEDRKVKLMKDNMNISNTDNFKCIKFASEEQTNNALLQEIQNESTSCEATEIPPKQVEDANREKLNSYKELETDTTITVFLTNDNFMEENLQENVERLKDSTIKCKSKTSLNSPENDTHNLLESSESETATGDDIKLKYDNNINQTESNCWENVKDCLQELEISLDEDILNNSSHSTDKHIFETSKKSLKDLEISLTPVNNITKHIISDNNKDLQEQYPEEPLHKAILDLLNRELSEEEIGKKLFAPSQQQEMTDTKSSLTNVSMKANFIQTFEAEYKNIHSKTPKITSILKRSNCDALSQIFNYEQNLCKGSQALCHNTSAEKNPAIIFKLQNSSEIMSNQNGRSESPNKENSLNILPNIKKEKLTASQSLINTQRGNQTPFKSEVIILKQNSKTQEISVKDTQFGNTKEQDNPLKAESEVVNTLQNKRNSIKLHKRFETAKRDVINSTTKTPRHSNLDPKSYAVNRSSRKKEVLQRMRNIKKLIFKSIAESECLTTLNNKQSPLIKRKDRHNVVIENITILPNLDLAATPFNNFQKPLLNNSLTSTQIFPASKDSVDEQNSICREVTNVTESTIKRRATSSLLGDNNLAKCQHISAAHQQTENKVELENTQLDLSESCVDFLQRDLKASRLSVESLFNSQLSEGDVDTSDKTEANNKDTSVKDKAKDDLIQQVTIEMNNEEAAQTVTTAGKFETPSNSHILEDFDDLKDLDLLAKIGLKIIKLPEIEDTMLLEEQDEMDEKARKFANIYKNWRKIWSPKYSEYVAFKQEWDRSFKGLLAETNARFNLKLNMYEIKRLVNLINIWFAHNACARLIEKRKISDSINRYLAYFFYIPKTIKRFYYCEYCEEYANTERKYYTHRIIHTGALFPHKCQKCSIGFTSIKHLQKHESFCNIILAKIAVATNMPKILKCLVCAEIFESSELLYEHSKTHLKNIYGCTKCDKVFASEEDVDNHLNICNKRKLP